MASADFVAAFWARVKKTEGDGCWIWTGPETLKMPGMSSSTTPRRLAWIIVHIIAPAQRVLHRGPSVGGLCVRPSHLCLGGVFRIRDEFSDLDMSRERKRQLRKLKRGFCLTAGCKDKVETLVHCKKHAIASREAARRRNGSIERYDSFTYHL